MDNIFSVLRGINKQKAKTFLMFLLCSFFAWSISKLSETYESNTAFLLQYQNLPDTLLLHSDHNNTILAKIRTSGFQFLSYSMSPKEIKVDLSSLQERENSFFLTNNDLENQIERQLSNSVSLLKLNSATHRLSLYRVGSKKVPVIADVDLKLAQNHLLMGAMTIAPDSVIVKGPKNSIADINSVTTESIALNDVAKDFKQSLGLKSVDSLGKVVLGRTAVLVSGTVVRFSERRFKVALQPRNVPEGFRLRMFPDEVEVVCKAGIAALKQLQSTDFKLFVDHTAVLDQKYLLIEEEAIPDDVFSVRLMQNRVEFVLEKL
ncbi:MAG: CdaR family protein [Bacteroidota bacterium]